MNENEREAVDLILMLGAIDGEHYKQWLLDQVLRLLLRDFYNDRIESYNADWRFEDWDEGIAP